MVFSPPQPVLDVHLTFAPSTFSLRPPSSRRPFSLQALWAVDTPPLLVSFPLTLEQMAGPALSVWAWLTGAGHQPLQKTSHMPLCPVSLPSIALSFNSPFPRSPPNLLPFIFLFYLSSTLLPSLWYRYLLVVLIVEMLSTPWYFSTEYRSVLIWSTFARMDPLFSLLFKHKYTDKNNTTIGHG